MILGIILVIVLAIIALYVICHVVERTWVLVHRPYFLGDCAFWGVMVGAGCLGAWLQP